MIANTTDWEKVFKCADSMLNLFNVSEENATVAMSANSITIKAETAEMDIQISFNSKEAEPYRVVEGTGHKGIDGFRIMKGETEIALFTYYETGFLRFPKEAAKQAAEAECARLNAEYRKEMEK